MFKVIGLLIFTSGLFLLTFWAKENLQKKSLLIFSIGMLIVATLFIWAININLKTSPGVGEIFKRIDTNDVVKMRELLSID